MARSRKGYAALKAERKAVMVDLQMRSHGPAVEARDRAVALYRAADSARLKALVERKRSA